MLYVREFEIFPSEQFLAVFPCDMSGATQGVDMQDAIESAADWLNVTVVDDLVRGRETEGGKLGHEPQHGGQIIVVAVDVDLARVPAYTAAEAARLLGVSPARVSQMCEAGRLTSWKEGSRRMIWKESVDGRLLNKPKPGRPRKKAGESADSAPITVVPTASNPPEPLRSQA
ncbi:helix-turn-helix domain-containing protein [Anaerotardibacter muris]|uniref:helix-turn-helix domain-containing protein n=1 Tax=Anaerotardibacter muris TaxID=2941505 RepID=UPI00203F0767|nr:helix-turn-helix domain-containing protein [Anaerotardibacter muris]